MKWFNSAEEAIRECWGAVSDLSAGEMRQGGRVDVSTVIGSSVNSRALIKKVFGSDSVDGFWTSQPILVVLCVPRRMVGGLNVGYRRFNRALGAMMSTMGRVLTFLL